MAATDKTRIAKPSPIAEDDQGQLVARRGISREVVDELTADARLEASQICLSALRIVSSPLHFANRQSE